MESIENLREYGHDCCARIDDAIKELADAIEAEVAERYVKLPVDADGEVIHIGDEMEAETGARDTVRFMTLNGIGWQVNERGWIPEFLRHHHAPTVEDVLREFAEKMNENMGMYVGEAIDADEWRSADSSTIAEYAAKLRLAGDAE